MYNKNMLLLTKLFISHLLKSNGRSYAICWGFSCVSKFIGKQIYTWKLDEESNCGFIVPRCETALAYMCLQELLGPLGHLVAVAKDHTHPTTSIFVLGNYWMCECSDVNVCAAVKTCICSLLNLSRGFYGWL